MGGGQTQNVWPPCFEGMTDVLIVTRGCSGRSRVVGEEEIRRQHGIMLDEIRAAGVLIPTVQSNVEPLIYATVISSHTLDGRLTD